MTGRTTRTPSRRPLVAAAFLLAGPVLAGCADEAKSSLERGDRLFGLGRTEEAIAEYKLAGRQKGAASLPVQLRLAHVYAVRGDVEASLSHYREAVARDSSYRFQAAADLTAAAREILERSGRERMARALDPVLEFGIELVPRDLRLELARHHSDRSEYRRALPLYLSVLADGGEVESGVHYRVARAYEALGSCREALPHFESYLEEAGEAGSTVDGARWHYGRCLYEVAVADERAGEGETSLARLERLIETGIPRTLMDRAHYLRGELLLRADRREEALSAFQRVLELNPARTGPLPRMADEQIRRIRYEY